MTQPPLFNNTSTTTPNTRAEVPPLRGLLFFSMFTQGSVRAFGTLATLGFAGVSCLKALAISLNVDALALY